MIVLGLNFGHDAGAAVIEDGVARSVILRERVSRLKHAFGLDRQTVELALSAAGVSLAKVDFVALATSQTMPYGFAEPEWCRVRLGVTPAHPRSGKLAEAAARRGGYLFDSDPGFLPVARAFGPEVARRNADPAHYCVLPAFEDFGYAPEWTRPRSFAEMRTFDYSRLFDDQGADHLFLPAEVTLGGRILPGLVLHHHLAHAAAGFFSSDMAEAAIFTNDGGGYAAHGYQSGMFYWGQGNRIHPIAPHHLVSGSIYENVGTWLGFDQFGGPGKLMGLAAYGEPKFYDDRFVGNAHDIADTLSYHSINGARSAVAAWRQSILAQASAAGADLAPLGDTNKILSPIATAIAASTQKLCEETTLAALACFADIVERTGRATDNVVLTGGCALNVVANQRVAAESRFPNAFVNPGADDSGIAMGAALAACHIYLNCPRPPAGANSSPYLGRRFDTHARAQAIAAAGPAITVTTPADPAAEAARDLVNGRVIAWFEGQSEIGPRALGHRSILADPRDRAMWEKVNLIKSRELWRPLAPSVLAQRSADFFGGLDLASPYMCFNATVRDPSRLGAITHMDNTARIQTVSRDCGGYFRLISEFGRLSGTPVVLNTSFNGPGEPIVDAPAEAIRFLLASQLDALYLDGLRITKV